jgi:hypothetical protein
MPVLSVQIPDALQHRLEAKAKHLGNLKISEVVRLLLQEALEQPTTHANHKLNQKLLHYTMTSYYMIQAQLIHSFKEGAELNEAAHQKANHILGELFKTPASIQRPIDAK